MEVGEAADQGLTVFSQKNKPVVKAFEQIAESIIAKTEKREAGK
jgi:DNA-directed RNA polymerase subunit K/omega